MPFVRSSGRVIGGVVAGISGIVILALVGFAVWYFRRPRESTTTLAQVAQQAESSSRNDDSTTTNPPNLITPYPNSTIIQHPTAPSPASHTLLSTGRNLPGGGNPSFYHPSQEAESGLLLPSTMGGHLNADVVVVHTTPPSDARDGRRLINREGDRRLEGISRDPGSVTFVYEDGQLPPDYHQATQPSALNIR